MESHTAGEMRRGWHDGPVGAVVGAVVGTVAGALAGKGIADAVDPVGEDVYLRDNDSRRAGE